MSKIFSRIAGLRIAGFFSNRTLVGMDKGGNRYFARKEEIDGIVKEKRWVVFKGEQDPASVPVEWICWLNGQRKIAPTPEEMVELEARRERIKLNVARLKEEEGKKLKEGSIRKSMSSGKVGGPDLGSFIQQFPSSAGGDKVEETSDKTDSLRETKETPKEEEKKPVPESTEPTGSGASFKPGTWQPPT